MRLWPAVAVWAVTTALCTPAAYAALPWDAEEANVLARAFAPTLVFHPHERYFPVSPLFPLPPGSELADRNHAVTELGTPEERVRRYDELPISRQLAVAALPYRVFTIVTGGRPQIAVEYWCHYVFNDYDFHGSVIGWRAADNHFNDLERVVFLLERVDGAREPVSSIDMARRAYVIRQIIASAHDGSITANVLDVAVTNPVYPPVDILVEKGSHAMAPDVDGDGRVTVGVDVDAAAKFLWGIRDHGETALRYRPAFTDERATGIRLCGPDTAATSNHCSPYALEPAETLQSWFLGRPMTASMRDRIVGRSSFLFRWFSDVKVEDLLIPSDRATNSVITSMTNRRTDREGGFSIGTIFGEGSRSFALGARRAWRTPGRLTPEVLASAQILLDTHGMAGVEVGAMGFYQLDVVTKAIAGVTWSDRHDPREPRWDVPIGFEFGSGRLRVRPNITVRGGLKGTQVSVVF